jgi:hypothetical protein
MEPFQTDLIEDISNDPEVEIFLHKDHKLKRWGLIVLGGITLLFVTLFSVLLILNTYTALQRHGRAILLDRVAPLIPLVVLGLPLGIIMILCEKNHWEDKLILEVNEIIRRNGKKHQIWPYKATQSMETTITNINFGGSTVGTKVKIILEDEDKQKLIIRNQYQNMADLIDNIRSRILPDLYKKAVQKLARGEMIQFRPDLIASKEGIEVNNKHLRWDETITTVIKNNKFILTEENEQEPFLKSKVKKISNLDLLLCLLDNPPIFED